MHRVPSGEVRFHNDRHAETPREAATGVGGVAAPELYVVEALHGEEIRFGIGSDEVLEAHKLETC